MSVTSEKTKVEGGGLGETVKVVVQALLLAFVIRTFLFQPFNIPTGSMENTLLIGDYLFVSKYAYGYSRYSFPFGLPAFSGRINPFHSDPQRGDIVVFKLPSDPNVDYVKRLIGLPGDTVELKLRGGDGYVYINGKPLKEPYIEKARRAAVQTFGPVKVKPGNYFMMGDNRSQSCDSRMWGTVPRANLIGKVFATYWPPNRVSLH